MVSRVTKFINLLWYRQAFVHVMQMFIFIIVFIFNVYKSESVYTDRKCGLTLVLSVEKKNTLRSRFHRYELKIPCA